MILYRMVIIENKIKVPRAGLKARFASFLADASVTRKPALHHFLLMQAVPRAGLEPARPFRVKGF